MPFSVFRPENILLLPKILFFYTKNCEIKFYINQQLIMAFTFNITDLIKTVIKIKRYYIDAHQNFQASKINAILIDFYFFTI